jgi:hypothetical protein
MTDASTTGDLDGASSVLIDLPQVTNVMRNLNVGYFWMMVNCATTAAYVISAFYCGRTPPLTRRFYIGACDAQTNQVHRIFGLGYHVLQQSALHTGSGSLFDYR